MEILLPATLCFLLVGYVVCMSEVNSYDPVIVSKYKNGRGIPVFHGKISEDERTVRMEPPLTATDKDEVGGAKFICGYRVISSRRNIPFTVELKDRATGAADIKLAEGRRLKYKKRVQYKFSVVAYDCGQFARESNRAIVFIKVQEVDEFAPTFERTNFMVEMEERKMYNPLLHIKATDNDKSPHNKNICDYELLTPNVPFTVDKAGNLRNTEMVDFGLRHNFILQVVAKDCAGKKSKPVFINIKVKEVCKSGWTDFPQHFEYTAGSGAQKLAPKAKLKWCDNTCKPEKVYVKMALTTKHIGKGCDRDTYSIKSQRKLCGATSGSVDLLPAPSLTETWTRSLPTDDGKESDQVFYFDGESNAVEVPKDHFNHSLDEHFTIMTWMKHEFAESTKTDKKRGEKEHVLCMSDGDHKNRRHYALYVHGEKLILLLRREAKNAKDMQVFKPAEWRWHIPQVNDRDHWHHYAISVDFPQVRLFVDGELLQPDHSNFEILDDWPLHRTKEVKTTKLVVGACWEGGKDKFEHYFHGYLAGLSVMKGKTESERVIHCLNNCQENLDFQALKEMKSGTVVGFNKLMTDFTVESNNTAEVERLLREVVYINARKFPTPGRRNVNIRTTVRCGNKENILPKVEGYIMVLPAQEPTITITGREVYPASKSNLKSGINIFDGVNIAVDYAVESPEDDDEEDSDEDVSTKLNEGLKLEKNNLNKLNKAQKLEMKLRKTNLLQDTKDKSIKRTFVLLDTCTVAAEPALDLHDEYLSLPTNMINQFNMQIEGSQTNAGLVITNVDKIENYILVVRGIRYIHEDPANFRSRKFILSCSSQNGRFTSNSLTIQLLATHQEPPQQMHAHAQERKVSMEKFSLDTGPSSIGVGFSNSSPNVGMVAIIVVCVGFLMFMIILGIIRIRAAHKKSQVVQVEPEMEWDNSELTITVNPMEQQEVFDYEDAPMKTFRDDSDTEDDCSSYHDDGDTSEEETVPKKLKDLEWDDSSL